MEAAEKFKVGDVVQLASGGPKMTVYENRAFENREIIFCRWFTGDTLAEGLDFPIEVFLVKVDAKEGTAHPQTA